MRRGRCASGREVHMIARPSEETVLSIDRSAARRDDELGRATVTGLNLDVIFPVLHGPYGEDGTIQGLLELANVPVCRRRRAGVGGRHGQGDR